MIDIVVNYRTSDEPLAALMIDQALTARLGPERVFRDNRTIGVGTEFTSAIWSAIEECQILVAVIGGRWLARDSEGNRRIDDPDDYVRREIAKVLSRGVRVVPVLVGDAGLPPASDLPIDLAELPRRQYRRLRFRGAEQDVALFADEMVALLGGGSPGTSGPAGPADAPSGPSGPGGGNQVTNNFYEKVHAPKAVFGVSSPRSE